MILDSERQRTTFLGLLAQVRALVADEGETVEDAARDHLALLQAVREAKVEPVEPAE